MFPMLFPVHGVYSGDENVSFFCLFKETILIQSDNLAEALSAETLESLNISAVLKICTVL